MSRFTDLLVTRRRPAAGSRPVTGLLADVPEGNFRPAPRHSLKAAREVPACAYLPATEAQPSEDGPERAPHPYPTFERRKPDPNSVTRATPVLAAGPGSRPHADPLDQGTPVWPGVRAVIGDSLPWPAAAPAAAPGLVLYDGPDWAALEMSRRVARGDWEELPPLVERGLDRNVAEMAVEYRHARAGIVTAAARLCAEFGWNPAELLRRTEQFNAAARMAHAAQGGAR